MSVNSGMPKISRLMVVGLLSALLVACASLGKQDCLSGDWNLIGNTDGTKGKLADERLRAHTKACNKHGVQLDQSAYRVGHSTGLKNYCTTENGYSAGSDFVDRSFKRDGYNNVCPADLKIAFLEGYLGGLKNGLESTYNALADERDDLDANRSAFLILKAFNSSKADKLEEKIEDADSSISEIEDTIDSTVNEIQKWLLAEPELERLIQ